MRGRRRVRLKPPPILALWQILLDRTSPGWRRRYDAEGFEVAFAAAMKHPALPIWARRDPGGVIADLAGERIIELLVALESGEAFHVATERVDRALRRGAGNGLSAAGLHEFRTDAIVEWICSLDTAAGRILCNIMDAGEERERYWAERHYELLVEPESEKWTPEGSPELREAAVAAGDEVSRNTPAPVLAAVRHLLMYPEAVTADSIAQKFGIHPSHLSRILRRIARAALRVFPDMPQELHAAFGEALLVEFQNRRISKGA